jgi:PAS domain S-box-containing protein
VEFDMKSARILIVEDEAIVAENLEMVITDAGYEVVGRAASADDAINAAIELDPDLILMYIVLLGQKTGIDASYEIKEKLDIPIIFLTAYSDFELVDRAKSTEPYAYIVKPFQERQLLASIETALYKSRMARKLKQGETKFRDLAELLPQTVFETDERGNLIFANRAGFDYFGYTRDDFEGGLTALQMVCPEDRDRAKENIGRVMKGEELGGVEYMMQRKDGSTFPVIIYATPIIHENKPVGMRGVIADITERKAAEEALRESEERYRILVERSPLGIFNADIRGNIEVANPALLRILGSHSEEATRQANLLTYPLLIEAGVSELVKECMEKGESLNSEFIYRSKWEKEVYCNLFLTPVYNAVGQLSGIQGILEDITERKAAEEALRESEERYRRMVANVPGMVYQFVLHPDGSMALPFVSESCRELFGMEPHEIRRDANILFDLIHPDDRATFYRSIADSAESLSPWGWEGRGIVSGVERWFQCISRPEQQVNGDILWDGLITEITDRKLAEKRIEEEYRRAEFYIDLMGHDINNASQVTSGYLDLLLQTPDLPDESRKHIEIALKHVMKSADIISDVKTLSEVRSGEIELAKIDICPAYRSAVEAVMSGSRDVRINSKITEGRHFIRGDAMLYSVFSNLLNNAVKFDRHDIVEIDVDISPSDDGLYWKLEFKDRGRGISDDYKNIIFNRLERAGESAQGTGLGLTIVKYIVESYGGSIRVEDRVRGDRTLGSNFIVLLLKGG